MNQGKLNLTASPNDSYLEEQLISCILNDHSQGKDCILECLKHSIEPDFFTGVRIDLWKAILKLHMDGHKVEEPALLLESKQNPSALVQIANHEASPANCQFYIDQLVELNKKRKLSRVAMLIGENSESMDADELKGLVYSHLESIVNNESEHEVEMSENIDEIIDSWPEDEKDDAGVKSGIPALDKEFKWRAGSLNIIAARPGQGKSALAAQVAFHNAVHENKSVAFFTMEMPAKDVGRRGICALSNVNSHRIKDGIMSQDDKWKVDKAKEQIRASKIKVYDSPGQTVHKIDALLSQRIPTYGLDLVVVDYLQLIEPHCKGDTRNEQVSSITRYLKKLAMKHKVPVIALSQFNRQGADVEPKLHHLRESGSIEQDCDNAVFIHSTDEFSNDCDIIIAKQRNGVSDKKIAMEFIRERGLFRGKEEIGVDKRLLV